jgi:metal-responsive CopG/Arc/MetJ family transcriptional regulator
MSMKTAVSLPDELYEQAEKTAEEMGIPRSQLFARALEQFIERHRRENITEQLNKVYSETASEEFEDISDAGLLSLRDLTRNDSW